MIINEFVVIYYFFLLLSFATGLLGSVVGLSTILRWKENIGAEVKYSLEKRLYLVSSAVFLGISLRLIMVPLWFSMLQSLIPSIPGAMCLAGVHQNVPFYSWAASFLKIFLPLLYITWILVSLVDKKSMEQPFLKFRHFFLAPLIVLLFVELGVDLKYLFSLTPTKVSCCTAMFDFVSGTTAQVFAESHWYFVGAFGLILLIQNALFFTARHRIIPSGMIALCSILLLISFVLALHTKLSPLILEAPFHHCIFCLLQTNLLVLAGTVVTIGGIYLSFSYGLGGILINRSRKKENVISASFEKYKYLAIGLYILGILLIFLPTINKLI